MRLLTTEILRLRHRRMLFWIVLAMLGLVVAIVVGNAVTSEAADLDAGGGMRLTDLWLSEDASVELGVAQRQRVATISVLCDLLVIVLAASTVGAEYRAGTVSTVLTWEPRRLRFLLARLGAAAIVGMIFFVVVHAVFVGGWALGAALEGTTDGAGSDFWRTLLALLARGTLIAGALAVLSASLATLGRNTAAALGIWFGYLVAFEAILTTNIEASTPWMLIPSTAAFFSWEPIGSGRYAVSAGAGGLHLALYVLVIGAVAAAVFTRRDVT
jgi:ABC-type transport system involved in multi-copper enzyme maturation permease subunit